MVNTADETGAALLPSEDAPKKGRPAKAAAPSKDPVPKDAARVKIILEENDEVPPTGLFLSVNGMGYLLKPGVEAEVPEFLLEVLDNASQQVPRTEGDRIVGYKQKLRFPYRLAR